MENSGKICWNLWKVEKSGKKCEKNFGKSLKRGKIWTNFEQYFLLRKKKMENSGKISWSLWKVEKFGKRCKMTIFGKSGVKIWTNLEKFFTA